MDDIEDLYDIGTGMQVITIVLNEDEAPSVHLDSVVPAVAISLFRSIAATLEECLPVPTISFEGEVIAEEFCFHGDFDNDEEDY